MNNGNGLDRMVKLLTKTNGNGDTPLIQNLLRDWELFRRADNSTFALPILVMRVYTDVRQALDQGDDDAPDTVTIRK